MKNLEEYLSSIEPEHRLRLEEIFSWTKENFPKLKTVVKWNQPMFTDHDTFIIGYSTSKKHLAIAPETVTLQAFTEAIEKSGYQHTDNIFKIPWDQAIDFDLLEKIIAYNIREKADCSTFWRK